MSYLAKAKAVLSGFNDPPLSRQGEATEMMGVTPNDKARCYLMRVMTDWSERAAMMTCGDLTVEQAEMAAWHDMRLDGIFWPDSKLH